MSFSDWNRDESSASMKSMADNEKSKKTILSEFEVNIISLVFVIVRNWKERHVLYVTLSDWQGFDRRVFPMG
jgi:hypothetical protein